MYRDSAGLAVTRSEQKYRDELEYPDISDQGRSTRAVSRRSRTTNGLGESICRNKPQFGLCASTEAHPGRRFSGFTSRTYSIGAGRASPRDVRYAQYADESASREIYCQIQIDGWNRGDDNRCRLGQCSELRLDVYQRTESSRSGIATGIVAVAENMTTANGWPDCAT